jgi:hypothetical protein
MKEAEPFMQDGEVSNFESLDETLQAVELEVLSEITPELALDRQNLVSAFQQMGVARVELGKAIAAYHQHFKAERAWLSVTPVLLKWIDRTSLTTLYNLIGDAERDQSLSGPRRAALKRVGINPTTRRNAGIVEQLAGGRDGENPEDADHAVQVALDASKAHFATPELASTAAVPLRMTVDEFAAEQIARAEDFAKTHPDVSREAIASAVILRLQVWAGISASQPVDIAATPGTDPKEESNHIAQDRIPALKVVSTSGKRKKKAPATAPTLFDFGAEQQERA